MTDKRDPLERPEYQTRAEIHHTRSLPHFQTVGEPPKNGCGKTAQLRGGCAVGRRLERAAAARQRLPAAVRLLPVEDGARGADPDRRRRVREGLLQRRPGRAADGAGAAIRLHRHEGGPHQADYGPAVFSSSANLVLFYLAGSGRRPGRRGVLHLGGHLQCVRHQPGVGLCQRHLYRRRRASACSR